MNEVAFDELLRRLADAEVRFVLIGGLALNAWGVVRGTKDVDVVADPDPDNLARLAQTVFELGGQVQAREAFVSSAAGIADLLGKGERVQIDTPLGSLDVIEGMPGVPSYAELSQRADQVEVLGVSVTVCALEDLRAMKRAAGRTRDLADLEDLDTAHGGN